MTVKEYTEYVLNNYQKEIIETSYDQRGRRKNILRNIQKLDKLKKNNTRSF